MHTARKLQERGEKTDFQIVMTLAPSCTLFVLFRKFSMSFLVQSHNKTARTHIHSLQFTWFLSSVDRMRFQLINSIINSYFQENGRLSPQCSSLLQCRRCSDFQLCRQPAHASGHARLTMRAYFPSIKQCLAEKNVQK